MAGPDLSIYQQFLRPPKSVEDHMAEADTREANRLALLLQREQMSDRERARSEQQRLMQTLQGLGPDASDDDRVRGLRAGGFWTQADALRGSIAQRLKAEAEAERDRVAMGKTKVETDELRRRSSAQQIAAFQSPADADAAIAAKIEAGELPPQIGQAMRSSLQALKTPQDFNGWKIGMLQSVGDPNKAAEFLAPHLQTNNTGGAVTTQAFNRATGLPIAGAGSVVPTTQSPDSQASVAATMRGQNMTDARAREGLVLRAAELGQRQREVEGENAAGGPILGVPVPAAFPWANQSNPRDANKVKAAEYTRGSKEVEKDADVAKKELDTANEARRFLTLNQKVKTGGLSDKVAIGRMLQGLGSSYAELEAITAKLAPNARPEGSGATSDYDAKQFERATVGVDKPRETNEAIANAIIRRADLANDYADFRLSYLEQNGTLTGADRYWKQYTDANTIFKRTKDGSFALNDKRENWRDFWGKKLGGQQPAPKPAAPAKPGAPEVRGW